jgi:acetyl-CoA C-acetyltransferase
MRRSKAPEDIGILVALKDRLNALKNPYAHLHEPEITYDSVKESMMLWEPIRYSETCPSSDGAIAMVIASESAAEASAASSGVNPAWIHGTAMRSEPATASGRDQVSPQAGKDCAADVYAQAGITNPLEDIDVVEMYVPFSWYEPMWLENLGFAEEGEGWKMTESGATAMDGALPINCSGGVLSTNPIGASGMIRFGEARVALGQAYGGAAQFFATWVVGSEKR